MHTQGMKPEDGGEANETVTNTAYTATTVRIRGWE